MKCIAGILALLIGAAANGAGQSAHPLLIFEFPDGVRGGVGKISGSGPLAEDVVPVLRRCGLARPQRLDVITHRIFVYGRASGRDQRIVACFKKAAGGHFNVGYGAIEKGRGKPVIIDEAPFKKFAGRAR